MRSSKAGAAIAQKHIKLNYGVSEENKVRQRDRCRNRAEDFEVQNRRIAYRMKVPTAVTSLGAGAPPSPVAPLLAKVAGASAHRAMSDKKNPWKMARTAQPITVFRLNREKELPSTYEEEAV
jgi:hypothetical protein